MGIQNYKRAAWARKALDAFMAETGQSARKELQEAIGDLSCNLLHLANQNSINAEGISAHAWNMYKGEINDDE